MKLILKIATLSAVIFIIILGCAFILRTNNNVYIANNQQTQNFREKVLQKMEKAEIKIGPELEIEKENKKIKLIAVGDMMLSRSVERKMIEYQDYKYPFLKTAEITSKADIVFGNLETAIISGRIINDGEMVFRTDPKAVEGLKFAGFNVLGLANNHTMNFGRAGLESTIKNLDENNISHAGAGLNSENIYKPALKNIKGTEFAFFAFTYNSDQRKFSGEIYGVADMDIEKMKELVGKAKLENDIVIVSMHAGIEYAISPNKQQKEFVESAIDAGADLVIGHHPHVVQTVEKYKDKYIIYSLGNFVFDQMWSNETRLGAMAEIIFDDKKVESINFIPIKIYDYAQPDILEGEEKEMILERLKL
jgi:poly-gamma-glutamate capsule biosynthesis protein CapA/YwtB (metallophosphatase superfamily)